MNKFKITFFGRKQGEMVHAIDIAIEVETPYAFINEGIAGKAINDSGFEYNYIKEIKKI
jgi:hypothetical protein